MSDDTALMDQALAAATDILSRFPAIAFLEDNESWLRPLVAIGFIEGRQAGGSEAKALIQRTFDKLLDA